MMLFKCILYIFFKICRIPFLMYGITVFNIHVYQIALSLYALYTVFKVCTVNRFQCISYTTDYIVFNVYPIPQTISFSMYILYRRLYCFQCISYTTDYIVFNVYPIPQPISFSMYILYHILYRFQCISYTTDYIVFNVYPIP